MAERLPRYRPLGASIRSMPSVDYISGATAEARGYESMSAALSKMSEFAFQKAETQRVAQWEQAGIERPRQILEQLSGKKYQDMSKGERLGLDKASRIMSDRVEIQARKAIEEISLRGEQEKLSPQEIDSEINNAVLGFSSSIDLISPEYATAVQGRLERLRSSEYLKASKRFIKQQEAEDRAIGLEGLDVISRNLLERSRLGTETAEFDLEEELGHLRAYLEHSQFTPKEITKIEIKLRSEANSERVRGGFYSSGQLPSKRKFLDQFSKDIQKGKTSQYNLDLSDLRKLEKEFSTHISKEVKELSPKYNNVKKQIKTNVTDIVKNGFSPKPSDIARFEKELKTLKESGIDVTEAERALDRASDRQKFSSIINQQNANELSSLTENLRKIAKKEPTPENIDNLNLAESRLQKIKKELSVDAVKFGKEEGHINGENFFILAADKSPEVRKVLAEQRIEEAEKFSARHNIPVQILDKNEKQTLITALEVDNIEQRIGVLGQIVQNFGSSSFQILQQISDERPEYAHIGGLIASGGDPAAIRDAMLGIRLIEEKAVILPKERSEDFQKTFSSQLHSLSFAPKVLKGIKATATAIYFARKGDATTVDTDLLSEAIQDAAGRIKSNTDEKYFGGIDFYKNVPVIISNVMVNGDLESNIERADAGSFTDYNVGGIALDPNGDPFDIRKAIDESNLVLTPGPQKYSVFVKVISQGNHFSLTNQVGGPLIVDLRKIAKVQPEIDVDALEGPRGQEPRSIEAETIEFKQKFERLGKSLRGKRLEKSLRGK